MEELEQLVQRQKRIAALICRLASKKKDQESTAAAEMLALGPEDVKELLTQFLALIQQRKYFPLQACGIVLCSVTLEIVLSEKGIPMFGMWGGIFAVSAAGRVFHSSRMTARLVARFEDVRVVGPLAEALPIADKETQSFIVETLIRLLPKLRETDADLLTLEQRLALNRALLKEYSPRLILAILQALKLVGDSSSILYVARLARGEARAKRYDAVQKAAVECLELLQESEVRKRRQETLVRPAEAPTENTLLRPASSVGDTEPQQLLRAASTPEQTTADTHNPTVSGTEEEARLPLSN